LRNDTLLNGAVLIDTLLPDAPAHSSFARANGAAPRRTRIRPFAGGVERCDARYANGTRTGSRRLTRALNAQCASSAERAIIRCRRAVPAAAETGRRSSRERGETG
jgi:hypothetical protein